VEAPSPSLPKGGGAIKSIADKLSLNPATGTASMSLPIATSPGRSGFGPELSLSYDSGAGNGLFGIGWQLSVPSISRKTDKGLPQYRDHDRSDTFILSGAEDLVPLLKEVSGNWVPDVATESGMRRERFRPRVESAFARIERVHDLSTNEVWWEATTRDNVTSIYGKSADARVVDPKWDYRVFRWLLEETRDDKGNVIRYEYKVEDLGGVAFSPGERHRREGFAAFANRHLKRILYGNKVGVSDPHEPEDFHFQIVFDYGEHDEAAPAPDDSGTWLARQDAFSSYRSGFDIRTYRLCRRVLVFHQFEALDELGGDAVLVRSTDLAYEEAPTVSYLTRVTHKGYAWNGSSYDVLAVPPVDLDYSRAVFQEAVIDLDAESLQGIPQAVDGRAYQWVDLDGEGVPGVLSALGGCFYYKRNLGQGKLAPSRTLLQKPSAATLQGSQQLLDVTGDGLPDLVDFGPPLQGFHPREDDETWGALVPFAELPNVDFGDPSLRFIDLDGDGFADVMMSGDHVYTWWPSRQAHGFGPPASSTRYTNEDAGATAVFAEAEQTIFLADMSGDGLQDLVRVTNGSVCYWPNIGYGDFGPMVVMGDAPVFAHDDLYSPSRVRLADLDGTGAADLIYLDDDGVHIWRNQAGNGFGPEETLAIFPDASDASTVDFVDLLGTGTMSLVWSTSLPSTPPHVRYVDLLGSVKPHLLNKVTNNLGLETRVEYAPSTKFYLEDRAAGVNWATRLPFPVHVVARLEHYDHVSKNRFVSAYRYRHGFYDPEEREFRGFGYVETRDAETFGEELGKGLFPDYPVNNGEIVLPPAVTKSWFHTGAWVKQTPLFEAFAEEWHAGYADEPRLSMAPMPDGLSPPELHQAHRVLAGRMLRQEVYAEDDGAAEGRPYVVTQETFEVRRLQPTNGAPYASFHVAPREKLTIQYERLDPEDSGAPPPRMSHELTLEVDALGYVTKSAAVGYGHPTSAPYDEQERTWVTLTEQEFFHGLDELTWYRHGVPLAQKAWEAEPGLTKAGAIYTLAEALAAFGDTPIDYDEDLSASERRLLSWTRERYWEDDLTGPLAFGAVEPRALPYQSYAKALTADMLSTTLEGEVSSTVVTTKGGYEDLESNGSYWAKSGITFYDDDAFFLVLKVQDTFGEETLVSYDTEKLFVVGVEDAVGNTVAANIDYRVLAPWKVTDENDNWTEAAFDELGRVVKTAVRGKNGEGDTLTAPTTIVTYELDRFMNDEGPARIKTERRETHADSGTRWLVSWNYADGGGNEILTKVSAEPGLAVELDGNGAPVIIDDELQYEEADPRWVGTGRTVFDNKGNPIKQYEPYFSPTHEYEDHPAIVEWGVTPLLHYDALGRLVRVDLPNGSYSRVEFTPWKQVSFDENDTVLETDNLWYAAYSTGTNEEQDAAAKAAAHAGTPLVTHFDGLGRPAVVVEDNAGSTFYVHKSILDVQGNVIAVVDPKDRTCMSYVYGMLGQVLKQTSIDAGSRWRFDTAAGEPVRGWGERDFMHRCEYDAVRRLIEKWVDDGTSEKQVEKLVYGEGHVDEDDGNLRGKVASRYDQAGLVKTESYDFKGNLNEETRELAEDYENVLDWNAGTPPALSTTNVFDKSFEYDALNRPTKCVLPDGTDIRPGFNLGGFLESVEANVRGDTTATTFVENIDYDEKGRRTKIQYSDGTSTTFETRYEYDELTFRLKHFMTERLDDDVLLQSLAYTYDPAGNITYTKDTATHAAYFDAVSVPSADGDYTYDAMYRLIAAEGREHASGMETQVDEEDMPLQAVPHPNDPSGLRRYLEEYLLDEIGNLVEMTHTPDSGPSGATWTREYAYSSGTNRLATTTHPDGTQSYAHDEHGNMTEMPHLAALEWDYADRLRHVEVTTGQDVWFVYGAGGERVRKVYVHSGLREERIYLGGYEVYRRWVVSPESLEEVRETVHVSDDARRVCMIETLTVEGGSAVTTPVPRSRFQLDDHLGTVAVEVDESGAVISYEAYHPYGTSAYKAATGEVSAKRYRYNGKERDEETSLYYYGARYYAPWLGRWTAADPAGLVDGVGLYGYCRGSPIGLRDPNGRQTAEQKLTNISRALTADAPTAPIYVYDPSAGPAEFQAPEVEGLEFHTQVRLGLTQAEVAPPFEMVEEGLPIEAFGASIPIGTQQELAAAVSGEAPTTPAEPGPPPFEQALINWAVLTAFSMSGVPLLLSATGPDAPSEAELLERLRPLPYALGQEEQGAQAEAAFDLQLAIFGTALGAAGALPRAAVGTAPELATAAARGGGTADALRLYHGTTPSSASRIVSGGFRGGSRGGAVFFAEDYATAEHFALEAMTSRGAKGATVMQFDVPSELAGSLSFERGVIGEYRGLRFVDIPGGTGYEQILTGSSIEKFNIGMKQGQIGTTRLRVGRF
jgi:RHS repeat-associated protein